MEQKKQFRIFTIFEYEKEQAYLRRMHREGWEFVRVSGIGCYHFRRCEPADVIYQLDYNQEGISHKAEYVRMFEDCGWEYLQDYVGYSYFRKPVSDESGAEEIFCDEESRLQMMERVMRGRMLPLLVIFAAVLLPQFITSLANGEDYLWAGLIGGLLVLYLAAFIPCCVQYFRYKSRIR